MKFSVLMSIYHKEQPCFFNEAMRSIWDTQTLKPNEIVLVEDGKLTSELYQIIGQWEDRLGDVLKRVLLPENQGLGKALNAGLKECQYDYVARMDTDDICMADRFEKQIDFLRENIIIDVCGSDVTEFERDVGTVVAHRKFPNKIEKIRNYAKLRNPVYHPAVIFKKQSVLDSGGYQDMLWFEDYYLWCRMLVSGAKFCNIGDTLLLVRGGESLVSRRRGWRYFRAEVSFQYAIYKINFLSFVEFVRNVLFRALPRILPLRILKFIYKRVLRQQ